jgi:hypothetical protein
VWCLDYQQPDDFLDVDSLEVDDSRSPSLLRLEWHRTSCRRIRTGSCDTTVPSTITWMGGLVIAGESTTFNNCYGGGTGGSRL